jgi:hypothetical protein
MAVFCTSAGCIGIWWYPFLKSILLKILHPAALTAKSIIFGKGYASGTVTVFSLLKSPHGRQDPSGFRTICSGDDQGLLDLWTIPSRSSCKNSAFAAASLSGSSRRNLLAMGGPVVCIWCSTSALTGGNTLEGFTTSLNSSKNAASHSGDSGGCSGPAAAVGDLGAASAVGGTGPALRGAAGGDGAAATAETVAKDCEEAVSTRHAAAGFTDNLKCRKKSTPIMGNFTFANRKIHEKRRP